VRFRGALHIHSTLSRDGTMTIAELARYYRQKGYQFLAMGEHAEDLDESKVQALREQSVANSTDEFCVIPGIEFAVTRQIHIVGIGVASLIRLESPVYVAGQVHEQGGMAILAHPTRLGWECPPEVLLAVDAAEIWNVGYDGKYLPSAKALPAFERMHQVNPKLLAVASHDFHRSASFYDVAVEMEAVPLSPEVILRNLKQGCYRITSAFFNCEPAGRVSAAGVALIRHVSSKLEKIRRVRSILSRRLA
jgi:predicted metal-dependent phosphoesterase TrpH